MTTLAPEPAPATKPPAARPQSRLASLLKARETGILLALVAFLAVTTAINPRFVFSTDGFRDLFLTPSILVVLAVGQAMVIITRNVDLSVGSILGLTAYLAGRLFLDTGLPILVVVLLAVLAGAVLGLVNGMLVAFARVPALVITLGTLYVYRGIYLQWAGSDRINASDIPDGLLSFGTSSLLGIPQLAIVSFVVLAVAAYWMRTSRGGRELYAIGSDPAAATLYGLKDKQRILTAFAASGALAGLAGILYVARYGTISSGVGFGIELEAVGAAVIGGVAIFGGSGTVVGAAIGAYLLTSIDRGLPILGIPDFWQRAVVGLLILGAIVLDKVLAERQHKKLLAERHRS
ncbi:ABC transporter permease [Nocardioides sp. CFH 31398]|uniref:ABC transporter permease n=1 Tax=Nocardioides sp. CFH 31398 TaxID=2919579 RepID=UPI001F05FFEE|nr:ABC transporter permease [Nocardioides sp. CFH 31398]MCH1867741.1 ABC transporter permease [Nocardioides sp. CFH 31398]